MTLKISIISILLLLPFKVLGESLKSDFDHGFYERLPEAVFSPAPNTNSRYRHSKNSQGADVIESACINIKCPTAVVYNSKNSTVLALLNGFSTGEFTWSDRNKHLLNYSLEELIKRNYTDIRKIIIYSHTDFENVNRFIENCPDSMQKTNACLRKRRREEAKQPLIEAFIRIDPSLKGKIENMVQFAIDSDDFRKTDRTFFDEKLLKMLEADKVHETACREFYGRGSCSVDEIKSKFSVEENKKRLREIYTAYRNVIIAIYYK